MPLSACNCKCRFFAIICKHSCSFDSPSPANAAADWMHHHLQMRMQVLGIQVLLLQMCRHRLEMQLLWMHNCLQRQTLFRVLQLVCICHHHLRMQLLGIHYLKLVWISRKFRTARLWEDAKCRGAQDGQKFVITEYTSL